MREALIVGNWKMNKTVTESIRLVTGLKNLLSGKQEAEVVVAPSFTALHPVSIALQEMPFKLAAQNIHAHEIGAFTGEVSASMVAEVGCTYVILGHSERRQHFGETNKTIREKIKIALEHDLIPIVCVGETAQEREDGKTEEVLSSHVSELVAGVEILDGSDLAIAYEPVWAIGTGNNAEVQDVQKAHLTIRRELANHFPNKIADNVRVIYGGSITPQNAEMYLTLDEVQGLLVGGASLEAEAFASIVNFGELDA